MNHAPLDHKHLIVNAFISKPPMSADEGKEWLHQLVELVDMQILLEANAIYCEDLGNEGVTGVVGLTTSHASFHAWHQVDEPYIRMDLYSCKDFSSFDVINHLDKFGIKACDYALFDRNNGIKLLEQGTR